MVGQGVLRECLPDPGIESVLAVGRSPTGQRRQKLREIPHDNFVDYSAVESPLYRAAPKYVTTTEQVGRAMIRVAREGYPNPVLENEDINRL